MRNGELSDESPRCGVIVLGMHRSGTSLVSHLFGELGLSHGGELMEPKPDNPLGYWEHAGVIDIHDDFLTAIGRDWRDPRGFAARDFESSAAERARRRLQEVFESDFSSQELWVLKDPRLCRLLPLWSQILGEPGPQIRFLHVTRHPWSVARSLAARNGMGATQAHLLWLRHELESERATRGWRRSRVCFEALIDDPPSVVSRACGEIGLAELVAKAGQELFERVIVPSQIHHQPDDASATIGSHSWIERVWDALSSGNGGRPAEDEGRLDDIAAQLARTGDRFYDLMLGDWLADWRHERADLRRAIDQGQAYARRLEESLVEKDAWARQLEAIIAEKDDYARKLEGIIAERDAIIVEKDRQSAEATAYTRDLESKLTALSP